MQTSWFKLKIFKGDPMKDKLKFALMFGAMFYLVALGFFYVIDFPPDRCNPDLIGTNYEYLFVSLDACGEK